MSTVVDHVGIRASDVSVSRAFYLESLGELGLELMGEGEFGGDAYVLFGRDGRDDFCIHSVGTEPGRDRVTTGVHIAFPARSAQAVQRWHAAAVRTGGTDIGPPGPRPEYSGNCYAAFVLDPDGNNVEAVFHSPDPLEA